MREIHTYCAVPEPGYRERLTQAVGRYFYGTFDQKTPRFHVRQLMFEHPDIFPNQPFLAEVLRTANAIYDASIPIRFPPTKAA